MTLTAAETTPLADPRTLGDRFAQRAAGIARRLVHRRLSQLSLGCIELVEEGRRTRFGAATEAFDRVATIRVRDARFYSYVALRGTVGAGESFMLRHWDCDDLPGLVRVLVANERVWLDVEKGVVRLAGALLRTTHWQRRNTRSGSRRNIEAHYDLGNDFFELFLDPTLTYSCARFPSPKAPLEEAQLAKLDRICDVLSLQPGDEVLEIGTGWGGFALHAASRYGARVTTTTLSRQQHAVAVERVREAGLRDRVTVLLQDYRDLRGQFDKLVSIEMIEAVGAQHLDTYFRVCNERLRAHGSMLLQAILTPDHYYRASLRQVDFMKRYIFPGGQLPSIGAICDSLARRTDLRLVQLESMGDHYAATLRHWRERFLANRDRIARLHYSDSFLRMWEFYLCLCEGGFAQGVIGVAQIALAKPAAALPCETEPGAPALG